MSKDEARAVWQDAKTMAVDLATSSDQAGEVHVHSGRYLFDRLKSSPVARSETLALLLHGTERIIDPETGL